MQIELGEVMSVPDFLEPALEFPLTLSYNSLEVPLSINGLLVAEDGKVLAQLSELSDLKKRGSKEIGKIAARGTHKDRELSEPNEHMVSLMAPLSKGALNHIDNLRDRNKKGDVVFKLILKVRTLNSISLISPLHEVSPGEIGPPLREPLENLGKHSLITYGYERDYYPKVGNLWLISGDNGPIFLLMNDIQYEIPKTIYASNWIHDFAPQLGIGRFVVAELPIPSPVTTEHEFAERLNRAFEALQKMEEKVKEGEWGEAIEKSRPVAELLRQEDMIRSILDRHGYHEDAADSLLGGIKSLFEYSSKFLHKVDKDRRTIPPDIKAEKEDAYLTYALSTGLVNLLTRKASKPESQ